MRATRLLPGAIKGATDTGSKVLGQSRDIRRMDHECGREHTRSKVGWRACKVQEGSTSWEGGSTGGPAPAARAHKRARGPVNLTPRTSERGGKGWMVRRGSGGELEGH